MRVFGDDAGAQADRAVVGELDRIRRVVEQRLLQSRRIAAQAGRVATGVDAECEAFGLRAVGDDGDDVGEQIVDGDRRVVEHELAGLDLRDVEDVVDDLQ